MSEIVYRIGNNLYINLTNRCSNNCDFCVRNHHDTYDGHELWLKAEPEADEVIAILKNENLKEIAEVVFCGYGEPLYRLDALTEIADYLKSVGMKTRINTNGQAYSICGADVGEKLKGRIDKLNISLNATDAIKYQSLCHSKFGEKAYDELLRFAKDMKQFVPHVQLSIVDVVGKEELEKAQKIAESVGVPLRIREYIE